MKTISDAGSRIWQKQYFGRLFNWDLSTFYICSHLMSRLSRSFIASLCNVLYRPLGSLVNHCSTNGWDICPSVDEDICPSGCSSDDLFMLSLSPVLCPGYLYQNKKIKIFAHKIKLQRWALTTTCRHNLQPQRHTDMLTEIREGKFSQ